MPTPPPRSISNKDRRFRIFLGLGLLFFLFSAWGLYDRRARFAEPASAGPVDTALTPSEIPKADQESFGEIFSRTPLDLNRASVDHLTTLPGIGPVLADRIVTSRKIEGDFGAVEDLLRVKGIGPKRLAKLRPYVTVEDYERSEKSNPNR